MRSDRIALAIFSVLLLPCPCVSVAQSTRLHLQLAGDAQQGFYVNVYEGNQLRITRKEEFSIKFFNLDLSTTGSIESWKGEKWSGNDSLITLSRKSYIKEFDANLEVSVRYEIVQQRIVKKTIRLFQPSMPDLYYILEEKDRPAGDPLQYTSFEHDDFPGGFAHEMFPAVGWITSDHELVGFLTDAGYKNQYTRTTRRRFSGRGGGFVGMRKLPDPELFSAATQTEGNQHNQYIRQQYGEMYNLDAGTSSQLQVPGSFQRDSLVSLDKNDSVISLTCHPGERAGISFVSTMKGQQVYTISFRCKGSTSLALKLYRTKNGRRGEELEDGLKYIDAFPCTENDWTPFRGSILVPYIEGDSIAVFIGTQSGKESRLQIKDFRIEEHRPAEEPYNILPMGKATEKISYAFIEPWKSHKDFMISAQRRLAEGKGFDGSLIEKMVYANFNMLTWVTSVQDFTPFNVPNMNYMPDMYNRDCFFSAVSTYNRQLNLTLWDQWEKTQTSKGAIGTIITPYMGSVEAKDNEASIEWLIWAMLNMRRFHIALPMDKIKKTVDYVLNEFDSTGNGICYSHFPLCQVDVIDFNPKTDRLAVNQGMLAIALRTIRELGFPITDEHINKAEQGYRNFYDGQRKHLLFDRNYPDLISPTDLEPEFFSLWLFNRPILTDEMVKNQLDRIPVLN